MVFSFIIQTRIHRSSALLAPYPPSSPASLEADMHIIWVGGPNGLKQEKMV
jgi:hypothetical protein